VKFANQTANGKSKEYKEKTMNTRASRGSSDSLADHPQQFGTWATALKRWRRVAWLLILIADAGLLAWGAMAALLPDRLPGPGSTPILAAEYESFTGGSWSELAGTSPKTAEFMTVLFRVYGAYNVAFGLLAIAITATAFRRGDGWAWWALLVGNTIALGSAMTYDWTVSAIGPFELSEYLGLAVIYAALAVTAPFLVKEKENE
jgi:RsiW-degrading membrane proteinase PrsW (M82 family)